MNEMMDREVQYRRGDVYFISFDGIGSEQRGIRPALIISNNASNKFSSTLTVIPMTSKLNKKPLPTHIMLDGEESMILCEQILTVDKVRVGKYHTHLDNRSMKCVTRGLFFQLGLIE